MRRKELGHDWAHSHSKILYRRSGAGSRLSSKGELGCDTEYSGQGGCLTLRPFLTAPPRTPPPRYFCGFLRTQVLAHMSPFRDPLSGSFHMNWLFRHYLTTFCDGTIWEALLSFIHLLCFVCDPWTINSVNPVSSPLYHHAPVLSVLPLTQ